MTPDLLIVGAGPAGIGAAIEAAAHGLSVMLLDENGGPGGRIWQALETRGANDADDAAGLAWLRRLRASSVDVRWNASVWAIEPHWRVFWSDAAGAHSVVSRNVLLATGAIERPLPIPGWTLPGVMTVGAAQIALKTGGLVPDSRTWLAGQGPLLLLYATQVLDAGGQIAGVIDLSSGFAPARALKHVSLTSLPEIRRGLAWRRRLSQSGVRWIAASELCAGSAPRGAIAGGHARGAGEGPAIMSGSGDSANGPQREPLGEPLEEPLEEPASTAPVLRSVSFRTLNGWQTEDAELLLLHDGIIPSLQITRALGCVHTWSDTQHCWYPNVDDWGRTSVRGILVAGDGAGIGGAAAAMLSGRIAARGLVNADASALQAQRARHLAVRPFLDTLFAPRPMRLHDNTVVCRCEEVTAGAVRRAARIGCQGMNQLKAYTRCGMGPCQGRMCGPVAIEVLADARKVPAPTIEPLRARFPAKPITVGDLIGL